MGNVRSQNPALRLEGLRTVSEALAFGDPNFLAGFPLADCCKEFIKILQRDASPKILESVTQCIVNILDCYPTFAKNLMSLNILRVFREKFQTDLSVTTLENSVHAVSIITRGRAKEVGQIFGIKKILKLVPSFRIAEQRYAIAAVTRVTSSFFADNFVKCFPLLSVLFSSIDPPIVNDALSSFTNVLSNVPLEAVPPIVIAEIAKSTSSVQDGKTMIRILELVMRLMTSGPLCEAVAASSFDWATLFNGGDFGPELNRIRRSALIIVRGLLPVAEFPPGFWESDGRFVPATAGQFAAVIIDHLIGLIVTKCSDLDLAISDLAMALTAAHRPVPADLFPVLIGATQDARLVPFALLLLARAEDDKAVKSSGLISHLSQIELPRSPIASWCQERLRVNTPAVPEKPIESNLANPKVYMDFPTLLDFVNTRDISPFDFMAAGFCERTLELILKCKTFQYLNFVKLRDLMFQLLSFSTFPPIKDPFP
jgi:hypothetical protein